VFGAPAAVAAAPAQAFSPATGVSRSAGCPDHAPVGQVYPLHRGGSLLVCASGPHRLSGLRQGDIDRMAGAYGAAKADAVRLAEADLMAPPPGYRAAWGDDRLNPNRAVGTPQGHQQMLQIWTDRVPQKLRDPAYAQPRKVAASSKSVPVARQAVPVSGARFVQVGSFGVPENAARAAARLQSLGLPVQVSRGQIKGKPVQVVRAGPFASEGQAVSALQAARGAGFGDAILRR
jgi:cell division septation protein DedD